MNRLASPMNRPALIALVAALAGSCAARARDPAAAAQKQATEMYQAFLRGDLDKFVDFTHPKIVELSGGREKMLAGIKKFFVDSKAHGLSVRSATVSAARQVARSGAKGVQAILPSELVFTTPEGELRQPSFLLGLSTDDGKTWKFVDTARVGGDAVRKMFPECSPSLEIPSRPEPQVSHDPPRD
jgi:hypothetical protein